VISVLGEPIVEKTGDLERNEEKDKG